MESGAQTTALSTKRLWAGRIMSALPALIPFVAGLLILGGDNIASIFDLFASLLQAG